MPNEISRSSAAVERRRVKSGRVKSDVSVMQHYATNGTLAGHSPSLLGDWARKKWPEVITVTDHRR